MSMEAILKKKSTWKEFYKKKRCALIIKMEKGDLNVDQF
jgi:hypothetical protein